MTSREATLSLGVCFGVGVFVAMALLTPTATDWEGAVLYGIGSAGGVSVGFPLFRRLAVRWRSRFVGGSAYPFVVGAPVGAATVTAVWGWANFMGFFGSSWPDTVLEALLLGLWNALILGFGFGHLFRERDDEESAATPD